MSPTAPVVIATHGAADKARLQPTGRLVSLDFFRGVTIATMILVNNPGHEQAAYWPLQHAEWNGWTPTDLIFPFFLFIVGVSTVFSFSSRLKRGESRQYLMAHALRRGVILFALGVFLNGFPNRFNPATIRIEGVLQRIAICYVISALLVLWSSRPWRIATIAICLVGYWVLMRFVSVPGFGVPARDIPLLDPDRNLAAWVDRKLFFGHLYEGTRDPEGVLSTIPAIATSLLGVLTGEWLRSYHSPRTKAMWMFLYGVIGLAAAEVLNVWFPINKKLWTSSCVIFTAGLALICLALCYRLLDIKKWRGPGTTFVLVFGMNAIAAYFFAEIVAHAIDRLQVHLSNGSVLSWQELIYDRTFAHLANPANASLIYAVVFVLLCWAAMWVLYRKGIFLKI